jgi:uncharacterized protein
MLEMRPSCECCDADLPPDQSGAFICSFECTFCRSCAEGVLDGLCPVRAVPLLVKYPASTQRIVKPGGCA